MSESSAVILVKDEEHLEQLLNDAGSKLVVIDFYAAWCGPCKLISPKIDQMAITHMSDVMFLKVDVDACETIAEKYNITSMPTFHFIKEKKPLENFSGANVDKLQEIINKCKLGTTH